MLNKYLLYSKLCVLGCDMQEAVLALEGNTNLSDADIADLTTLIDDYDKLSQEEKDAVLGIIKNPKDFYIFKNRL